MNQKLDSNSTYFLANRRHGVACKTDLLGLS